MSEHEEPINIWNKRGCDLPNGGLCTACCYYFEVDYFNKPRNKCCDHQSSDKGCLINDNKPPECVIFHCSQVSNHMKWGLATAAEGLKIVTHEEADRARSIWIIS